MNGLIKICEYCSSQFTAKRHSAKFCSNACRTKAYRKRHNLPFPDFSKVIHPKQASDNEKELRLLHDELDSIITLEKNVEQQYKIAFKKYENALLAYDKSPSSWAREYINRRRKEYYESKNNLDDLNDRRGILQQKVKLLQMQLDKEILVSRNLVVPAEFLRTSNFDQVKLEGTWRNLLGRPAMNFTMLITGKRFSGKTTFSLLFAKTLSDFGEVVFFAMEDNIAQIIRRKVLDLEIEGIDFSRTSDIKDINTILTNGRYKFVFYDALSEQYLKIKDFLNLIKRFPDIAFIGLIHTINQPDKISGLQGNTFDYTIELKKGMIVARSKYSHLGEIDFYSLKEKI